MSVPQPIRRFPSNLRIAGILCGALIGVLIPASPARAQIEQIAQIVAPPDVMVQPQVTGYPVTGRVVCADTQRAARFANVVLISAAQNEEGGGRGGRASARTDLDGNFLIPNVIPGEYYVTAGLTGYINEAPLLQTALGNSGSSPTAPSIPANVPKIRVGAGGASALLSLQRGGVVAGTVQWDDGSPAAGVGVSTAPAPTEAGGTSATTGNGFATGLGSNFGGGPGAGFGGGFSGGQTDDRGRFRLSGIPPGTYLVRASVQAPAPANTSDRRTFARNLNLSVYAPDKLRRTDAAVITVAAGEERNDLSITMNLAVLHSVSGTVNSTGGPVRSGTVTLTDSTDPALNRTGAVNADGSFLVPYVPPGNYTLRAVVNSVAQTFARGGQAPPAVRFQPLEESLAVADSDLTGLSLNVAVATGTGTTPP